ncbi:biofilm development regulator YmgB/AriR family protein [Pantoea sp. BAV 3049]|uniref:biofilm development regulator YmgB/AriR family protein n=1 Tax=Pantoea sp. BAV 3049 TaxID=2654188 RepID=UPI00131E2D9B|nr:biofilm development regulator YmgB/AriR family protein [Pantoea sp. BAV 3049]
MQESSQISHELTRYFKAEIQEAHTEVEILGSVVVEILQSGMPVTNKALIARLLQRMEGTSDVISLDVHRSVLEMVVHQTEDDLIA